MSKELIERLRNAAILATSECAWLMTEAADALEAKASPVGEREAFEAEIAALIKDGADIARKADGEYRNFYLQCAWQGFQAGAAYQRQQAREVVIPPLMPSEPFTTIDRGSKNFKAGWNAYAQEFARLNGKEVGRG